MTFCGSSDGSCTLGRPGPEDCVPDDGLGDGVVAARAAGAAAVSSSTTSPAASTPLRTRVTNEGSLSDEAGREVDDRPGEEAQDHADHRPHHQRLAALLAADGPLGQVEARPENEREDAHGEQDALDPAGDAVQGRV